MSTNIAISDRSKTSTTEPSSGTPAGAVAPKPEPAGLEGDIVREIHLKISPQYANIAVIPKPGEGSDKNFPRNLHNAAELFLRVGMVENSKRVKECTDGMISLYADNPDGKSGVRIGNACVCWNCGYCGLPKGFENQSSQKEMLGANGNGSNSTSASTSTGGNKKKNSKKKTKGKKNNFTDSAPGPCHNCNESDQINWLKVTQKENNVVQEMPWIENAPLTAEEAKKKRDAELAAKRAEVEARVKKAMADRERERERECAIATEK